MEVYHSQKINKLEATVFEVEETKMNYIVCIHDNGVEATEEFLEFSV